MTQDGIALMCAVFAGACLLAAFFGFRSGNARRDVALMGGSGAAFGAVAALVFAS